MNFVIVIIIQPGYLNSVVIGQPVFDS